jgi:hypothetical protein
VPNVEPPEPTRLGEVIWLEPSPDARIEASFRSTRVARPNLRLIP